MSEKPNIIFVDDDIFLFQSLKKLVPKEFNLIYANTETLAKKLISTTQFNFAILDLNLTNENNRDGFRLVEYCTNHKIPSVLLTSEDDIEIIKKGYQLGCLSFFTKWNIKENFEQTILPVLKEICIKDNKVLEDNLLKDYPTNNLQLKNQIFSVINRPFNLHDHILLTGPTGVGKSKLAKFIHKSTSPNKPFVSVNLNEYPEQMIESILFGHTKGSFTGALSDHDGILKTVDKGTLFLDEIGVLSLSLQQKLLRVIEEKTFFPVGSNKKVTTSFRLITATCDNLKELIKEKKFRTDLYFRINKDQIDISPLSARPEDIHLLINYIINSKEINKKIIFSDDALEKLLSYPWPGNIRELKSCIERIISNSSGYITGESLNFESTQLNDFVDDQMFNTILKVGLTKFIQKIEDESVLRAWNRSGQKVNQTIRDLKISKSLFYRVKNNG